MMKWLIILVLILTTAYFGYTTWKAKQPASPTIATPTNVPPAQQPKKEWKPEDIAKDPTGYLVWSQQQIADQIKGREQRLAQLSARRKEFVDKQQAMVTRMDEVANFRKRLQTAYQRAEDEDRWPVRMAGTTYTREKALDLIQQTQAWLDDRKDLAGMYDSSLAKMDDTAAVLKNDIAQLNQLNEKIALDQERVRINQSMADIDKYRQTETQLASMSKALSQMSDEQAPVLPTAAKSSHVDIDSIVK
jgi:DNA repair exonuclease SbcCD ATPase subunit